MNINSQSFSNTLSPFLPQTLNTPNFDAAYPNSFNPNFSGASGEETTHKRHRKTKKSNAAGDLTATQIKNKYYSADASTAPATITPTNANTTVTNTENQAITDLGNVEKQLPNIKYWVIGGAVGGLVLGKLTGFSMLWGAVLGAGASGFYAYSKLPESAATTPPALPPMPASAPVTMPVPANAPINMPITQVAPVPTPVPDQFTIQH